MSAAHVPASVLDHLRRQLAESNRRNLRLTAELLALLDLLEQHAIRVVPLKGPALAAAVYGDLALRQFLDLDILVHKPDVPRATELLRSRGYRERPLLTDAQEAALLRHDCERGFVRDDGTLLELHWDLVPAWFSLSFDHRSLWDRRETVCIGGTMVPTLGADDLLLFLCIHGAKHLWARLKWVCDVAAVLHRAPPPDLTAVLAQARAIGAERMVLLGLRLAADLLEAPLPDDVQRRAQQDRTVSALATQVQARLFRSATATPLDLPELHRFCLRARERWRDRVRYVLRVAVTPAATDWTSLPLPRALHPLYYVVRPIRVAVKYGARLIRGARGGAACAMFCLCTSYPVHSPW